MPSLVALNAVRQALIDADAAVEAAKSWTGAHAYAVRRDEEEAAARRRAAVERMHAHYMAKFREKQAAQAKAAARAATSGPGWAVSEHPRVPHADLEALGHRVWEAGFVGLPFPRGWRIRWGRLRPTIPGTLTLARAVASAKMVILDEGATWVGRRPTCSRASRMNCLTSPTAPRPGTGSDSRTPCGACSLTCCPRRRSSPPPRLPPRPLPSRSITPGARIPSPRSENGGDSPAGTTNRGWSRWSTGAKRRTSMPISIHSERADGSMTGVFSDADMKMLLEARVRELLAAEAALRDAQQKLDLLAERCRHQGQAALVTAALRDLAARRPA